jgi:hypothetical protein
MKPEVTRTVHFKELHTKVKRYVTIHYNYNRLTKTLKYGGVIFKITDNTKYDRLGHIETAKKRYETRPITITNFTDDKDIKWFHQCLRKQLYFYGVQSPKGSLKTYPLTRVPKEKALVTRKPKLTNVVTPAKSTGGDITKMKPVITRCVNIKEAHGKVKRTITIKYEYDRVNKVLKYGATIHKSPVEKPEPYDRVGHYKTAEERFKSHPVVVNGFTDNPLNKQNTFNTNLRGLLFRYGVKAK